MTDYLHTYNVVIDPEQGTQLPDGSWTQEVTLVLLDGPGTPPRRLVAFTLTPRQASRSTARSSSAASSRRSTVPVSTGSRSTSSATRSGRAWRPQARR